MGVPFLVPSPKNSLQEAVGKPDVNPVDVYLTRLGPGSRQGMSQALDGIARFLTGGTSESKALDWATIRYQDTSAIRGWLVKTYAPATAKRMIAALRGVLTESWRLGLMSHDDYARGTDIAPVRGETEPRGRALTNEELLRLFQTCSADSSPAGVRDGGILAVLYGLGLRRSELIALDVADYDPDQGTLAIKGKGNKPRIGYVLEQVKELLRLWIAVRGRSEGPIFVPVTKGGNLNFHRLTPQAVALIVKKRAAEAEVEKFSCHDLRRSFITDLLEAGADLSIVQQLAGHRQVTTTTLYDKRGEAAKVKAAGMIKIPTRR
jgi:integrase